MPSEPRAPASLSRVLPRLSLRRWCWPHIGQQLLYGRPIERGTGECSVVVALRHQAPAFVRLALYVGLAGLTLGIERGEGKVEVMLGRLASINGAAQEFADGPVHVTAGCGELSHVALSPTCPFHKAAHREGLIRGPTRPHRLRTLRTISAFTSFRQRRRSRTLRRFARGGRGGPLRGAARLLSSATLRRSASMRLTTPGRRGKALRKLRDSAGLFGLEVRQ